MALVFGIPPATGAGGATPGTLMHDAVIQGVFLPAGTIVTDRDRGHLAFVLKKRFRISGWMLPADTSVIHTQPNIVQYVLEAPTELANVPFSESVVTFQYGKLEGKMTISRNAVIGGIPCAADAEVYFHNGAVIECDLSRPTMIQGVPCTADDFGDADGRLQCTLDKPYKRLGYTWPAQTRVDLAAKGTIRITTGPKPSDMLLFGRPLPPETDLTFDGKSFSLSMMKSPVLYQGCHLLRIDFEAEGSGSAEASEDSHQCLALTVPRDQVSPQPR